MITIIDYGLGNIKAFENIYKKLNISVKIAKTHSDFVEVTKLILPGVGAFDYAMEHFKHSGMLKTVERLVAKEKIPILGVCVGMQILANKSEEGKLPGLGWIDADVVKFKFSDPHQHLSVPHMGWNDIKPIHDNPLFKNFNSHGLFYFLHSFYFNCKEPMNSIAKAIYGEEFTCAVNRENIYGVQFHPEKSHEWGIQLLKNFAEI